MNRIIAPKVPNPDFQKQWDAIPDSAYCQECFHTKDEHWYDDDRDEITCKYSDGYCETCYYECTCETFVYDDGTPEVKEDDE